MIMKAKFAKRLGIAVEVKPEAPKSVKPAPIPSPEHTNSRRYPEHKDVLKGQVFAGECNRTDCENRRAVFWNVWTNGFYCVTCARGINYREKICYQVQRKPTIEEQSKLQVNSKLIWDVLVDLELNPQ